MIKKEYMAPEVEVVKIGTMQMMAASVGIGDPISNAGDAEAPELPGMPDDLPGMPSIPGVGGFPFE